MKKLPAQRKRPGDTFRTKAGKHTLSDQTATRRRRKVGTRLVPLCKWHEPQQEIDYTPVSRSASKVIDVTRLPKMRDKRGQAPCDNLSHGACPLLSRSATHECSLEMMINPNMVPEVGLAAFRFAERSWASLRSARDAPLARRALAGSSPWDSPSHGCYLEMVITSKHGARSGTRTHTGFPNGF